MKTEGLNLEGRTALVTGGSGGLGLAVARRLCEAGCAVAIAGRREEALREAERILKAERASARVATVCADAATLTGIKQMAEEAERQLGPVDILVNNAGTNVLANALEVTEEDWDRIMDLNLKGLFFCCQEIGKRMVARRKGIVINMASQMGLVGYERRAAYCASKGGVVQLTKVLAIEWAPYGIRVNAVAPTFVETELTRTMLQDESFRSEAMRRIPMGKFARPEHVADAVLYLASDMSAMVTGHTLPVDGGWVIW